MIIVLLLIYIFKIIVNNLLKDYMKSLVIFPSDILLYIYIYLLITIKISKMTKVTSQALYKKEYRD